MTVKINADTSDGLKFVSDTSGEIDLQTNGSTKVHMASDGKVGIGTNAPESGLHLTDGTNVIAPQNSGRTATLIIEGGTETADLQFLTSQNYNHIFFGDAADANAGSLVYDHSNNSMQFTINASERFRVESTGKVLFGSTTAESTANDNMQINTASDGGNIYMYQSTTSLQGVVDFRNPNGYIGSIQTSGSSTAFNTSSDYRMKDNVNYTWNATDTVKSLKPCSFTFKADTDTTVHGFIAHELQEHIPHAVSGVKDATKTDGDGSTIIYPQGVDLGKIVPYLVKTIQELETRITALES